MDPMNWLLHEKTPGVWIGFLSNTKVTGFARGMVKIEELAGGQSWSFFDPFIEVVSSIV
jgi:hypothetical protein